MKVVKLKEDLYKKAEKVSRTHGVNKIAGSHL